MSKVRKAVIPAAGFGTRFLPATKSMPKEMLPIIDKPIIHFAVEEAVKSGIEEIIFITGRGKRAIEDYFDHSFELEYQLEKTGKHEILKEVKSISDMADVVYIRQKEPLGLGHAILRAKELVGDEPFAVILPDDLFFSKVPCTKQLIDTYEKYGKSVIGVIEEPWEKVHMYGIVDPDGEGDEFPIKGVVEKPKREEAPSNLSSPGRYVFTPSVFECLEKTKPGKNGEIQLPDGYKQLIDTEGLYGVKMKGEHYDAGDKLGFLKATINYALNHGGVNGDFREYLKELYKEKL